MNRYIYLVITHFFISTALVQAQFEIEVHFNGSWMTVKESELEPDQAELIFGPVGIGTVVDREFRFTNNTADTVSILGIDPDRPEFEILIANSKINPGTSENFTVRYTAGSQSRSALFNFINDSPGDTATYTFRVLGLVLQQSYKIEGRESFSSPYEQIMSGDSTPSVSDGTLFPQPSAPFNNTNKGFNIVNTGTAPLTFTSQNFSGPEAAEFSVLSFPTLPFTLQSQAEEAFSIRWQPLASGVDNATFELVSEISPTPFTFALEGQATSPEISVALIDDDGSSTNVINGSSANSRINYGASELNAPHTRIFEIANTGFTHLSVYSITSDNSIFQANHTISSLAPGASEQFTIVYTPAVSGADEAIITIASNAPGDDGSYQFITKGYGDSDIGSAEIVVTSTHRGATVYPVDGFAGRPYYENGTDFGEVAIGSTATRKFTITNIGTTALVIDSITLDNTAKYSVPNITTSIPAGGETTFTVTYSPTTTTEDQTILSIVNNDPDDQELGSESPFRFIISGIGALQVPDISVSTSGLTQIPSGSAPSTAFGTLFPETAFVDVSRTITLDLLIANSGDAPLEVHGVSTQAPFESTPGFANSRMISSGESTALTIRMITGDVSGPGVYRSNVTVFSNDGDDGFYNFDLEVTVTDFGDAPRIVTITESDADILLHIFLPVTGNYYIDESEDLSTWTLMDSPLIGIKGTETKTLNGRAIPPASGRRFFRLRFED